MNSHALYNEIEPFAAAWLEELAREGHIAPGRVERRSVADLAAADVAGPGQRHFFAGIGVWSYALRLAGVPDDASVWTGSCPCQPFSGAGKGLGIDDPRHLWPTWFKFIDECRPAIVFGEQVASPAGLAWLDAVYADLEGAGYSVGAADLCAAGVGAPHIRQRIYFVAYAVGDRRLESLRLLASQRESRRSVPTVDGRGEACGVADADPRGRRAGKRDPSPRREQPQSPGRVAADGALGDAAGDGDYPPVDPGATRGFWAPADWLPCSDGVSRPVEPGTFPLAHGAPARVGRLRGYGNGLVSEQAAAFIEAALAAIAAQAAD